MLKSKKFWMSIAGVIAVVMSHLLNIPEATTMMVLAPVVSYIIAQGWADSGKEAKKIEAPQE